MRIFTLLILLSVQCLIAAPKYPTLDIGAKAPDFKLKGVDDKMHSLADYKSKVLCLSLNCKPLSNLHRLIRNELLNCDDYKDKGVELVAIHQHLRRAYV